ncbi:MAG: type II secretion system protein [Phycisphaerales bacterium JB050]
MKRSAFTLIELLVVVAVIGVLIAILLPALNRTRLIAEDTKSMSNIRQNVIELLTLAETNSGTMPMGDPHPDGWSFAGMPGFAITTPLGFQSSVSWFAHSDMWHLLVWSAGGERTNTWISPSRGNDDWTSQPNLNDYKLTETAYADPHYWNEDTDQFCAVAPNFSCKLLAPQRLSTLASPTAKGMLYENPLIAHRRRPNIGTTVAERQKLVPVPVGFFDGHADIHILGEAKDQGVANQPYFQSKGAVLTTTNGFRGRDF